MPRWVEPYRKGYRVRRRGHPSHHLAGPDATRAEVWAAYELWEQEAQSVAFTLGALLDLYFASPAYTKALAPQTQVDYLQYSQKIRAVFGEMDPNAITSPMVTMYMDARAATKTAANHERGFLSMVMDWGKARGFVSIANPVEAVRPFKLGQGGRYVEDWEYNAFYDWLEASGHTAHLAAMEISYLCAARQQDVLALTRKDKREEGLMVYQQKTGKKQLKLWTPRLLEAVELGLKGSNDIDAPIVRSRKGLPYTRTGFNSIWRREQIKAQEAGKLPQRFRFHDLKIKGISDFEGDKQAFSGHKTSSMAQRYNRTADRVVSLDKQRERKCKRK